MTLDDHPMSLGTAWSVFIIVLANVITGVVCVIVATRVDTSSNRRWCSLVSTLDDAYTANPPATLTGRRVAEQIHELRSEFGCVGPERQD